MSVSKRVCCHSPPEGGNQAKYTCFEWLVGLQYRACTAPRGALPAYVTKAAKKKKPNARYDLPRYHLPYFRLAIIIT